MVLDNIFTDFIFAAIAAIGFCILFNAPRKKIPYCAVCGGLSWVIYIFFFKATMIASVGIFTGALFVSVFSRICAHKFDMPFTLFFVPSIIPLVPGSQMYNFMKGMFEGNMYYAFNQAVIGLQYAALIMAAFIIVYTLPPKTFFFKRKRSSDLFK